MRKVEEDITHEDMRTRLPEIKYQKGKNRILNPGRLFSFSVEGKSPLPFEMFLNKVLIIMKEMRFTFLSLDNNALQSEATLCK